MSVRWRKPTKHYEKLLRGKPRRLGQNAPLSRMLKIKLKNARFLPAKTKTVLESSDDVASVKLGGKWRMPTDAEWTELRTKCTWTWTDSYKGKGVKGQIVTATNGNSIFLPAAGDRLNTNLYSAGSRGIYWSSSLYTGYPDSAWNVFFNSDDVRRSNRYRYIGLSVRPVSE